MGKFTKDLPDVPALDDNIVFPIGNYGTSTTDYKTYKTSLGDVADYIGQGSISPPLVLKDDEAYTSSVGTVQITAGGSAHFSSSTDFDDIEIGEAIILAGPYDAVITILIAKPGPSIGTIIPPPNKTVPYTSFSYGPASIITKDSSDNIVNVLSKAGFVSTGSILVKQKIESDSLEDIAETHFVDGMVTRQYQPSFCAVMTGNQTLFPAAWNTIAFNRVDGLDTSGISHSRVPYGQPSYNTTAYVFPVPYTSDYSQASYTLSVGLRIEWTISASSTFHLMLVSSASSTLSSALAMVYRRVHRIPPTSPLTYNFTMSVTGTVMLDPLNNANHRYLGVLAYPQAGTTSTAQAVVGQSFFSGVCHG